MTPEIQTVIDAYRWMGRPNMAPDDPDVLHWADMNATPVDIWTVATNYLNDPQWATVARNAAAILDGLHSGSIVLSVAPSGAVSLASPNVAAPAVAPAQASVTPVLTALPPVSAGASSLLPVLDVQSVKDTFSKLTPLQWGAFALVALLVLRR